MNDNIVTFVKNTCKKYKNDPTRLMDVSRDIEQEFGCVSGIAMDLIASELSIHRVDVESLTSFYAFLSKQQKGKTVIRLCNDVIDELKGSAEVAAVFSEELGIKPGKYACSGAESILNEPPAVP